MGVKRYYDENHMEQMWEDFLNKLPMDECLYILFNFPVKGNSKGLMIFSVWYAVCVV